MAIETAKATCPRAQGQGGGPNPPARFWCPGTEINYKALLHIWGKYKLRSKWTKNINRRNAIPFSLSTLMSMNSKLRTRGGWGLAKMWSVEEGTGGRSNSNRFDKTVRKDDQTFPGLALGLCYLHVSHLPLGHWKEGVVSLREDFFVFGWVKDGLRSPRRPTYSCPHSTISK